MKIAFFLCLFFVSCVSKEEAFLKAVDKNWAPSEEGELYILQGGREILSVLRIGGIALSNTLIFDGAKSKNEAYYLQDMSISENIRLKRSLGLKISKEGLLWMGYTKQPPESLMPRGKDLADWEYFRDTWWGKSSVDFEGGGIILGK